MVSHTHAHTHTGLQQEQPHLYDSLTKNLNHDEQTVIQGVIHQAEANALSAAQQQQEAQVNGGGVDHHLSS